MNTASTKHSFVVLFLLALAVFPACESTASDDPVPGNIPSPVGNYCAHSALRVETRQTSMGHESVCIFSDGSECEEMAFFLRECASGGCMNWGTCRLGDAGAVIDSTAADSAGE
jgi:putative hemolysin